MLFVELFHDALTRHMTRTKKREPPTAVPRAGLTCKRSLHLRRLEHKSELPGIAFLNIDDRLIKFPIRLAVALAVG